MDLAVDQISGTWHVAVLDFFLRCMVLAKVNIYANSRNLMPLFVGFTKAKLCVCVCMCVSLKIFDEVV